MQNPDNVTAAMGYAIRRIQAVSWEDYLSQLDAAYRAEMGEDLADPDAQRGFGVHPDQMEEMEDRQAEEYLTAEEADHLAYLRA